MEIADRQDEDPWWPPGDAGAERPVGRDWFARLWGGYGARNPACVLAYACETLGRGCQTF